jgi:uncharacterized protein (DUF362 family)
MKPTTRRQFLRHLSLLAAAGCAPTVPARVPDTGGVPMPAQSGSYPLTRDWRPLPPRMPGNRSVPPPIVGTARAEDRHALDVARLVREAVEQAGGLSQIIRPGDRVLIKPNLVTNAPSGTGFTTDIRVAEAVAKLALDAGARTIVFAEGTAAARGQPVVRRGATGLAFAAGGFVDLAKRLDAELVDLNEAGREPGGRELVREVRLAHGLKRTSYWLSKTLLDVDRVISVPVLKNHEYTGVTLALKNWIGVAPADVYHLPGGRVGKGSLDHSQQGLARHIVDLVMLRPPDYAVIDALVGINTGVLAYPYRPGPGGPMRAILAGADPVSVDTVGCLVMSYAPETIGHLVLAEAVGLGVADPGKIEVRGVGIEPLRQDFAIPVNGRYVPGRYGARP